MAYQVKDKAGEVVKSLEDIKIDLTSYDDVIEVNGVALDLSEVVEKLKNLVSETTSELNSTENIGD